MKTEKPHRPYYQQTVDETLTNIQSSLDGLSSTEATAGAGKIRRKRLTAKNRVNWLAALSGPFQRCPYLRPSGGGAAEADNGTLGGYVCHSWGGYH